MNLTGDIFLGAAFVSYLGAFTGPFRHSLAESWAVILRDKGVRVSDGYSLAQVSKIVGIRGHLEIKYYVNLSKLVVHRDG